MVGWPYHILKKRMFQLEEYDKAYKAEMDKQEKEMKSKQPSTPRLGAKVKMR